MTRSEYNSLEDLELLELNNDTLVTYVYLYVYDKSTELVCYCDSSSDLIINTCHYSKINIPDL